MITIEEAFAKFRGRQELTTREQEDVSRRHRDVRDTLAKELSIERDFLTGSYDRWTKTRPLRDVDVMCVLGEGERSYRRNHPRSILERVREVLAPKYGDDRVTIDRMAVVIDFGVAVNENDETDDKVMSIEVVPAFPKSGHYEIPDDLLGIWISTDPEVHAQLAVDAHAAYNKEWKPIVRMFKKWNRQHGHPVSPSFLVEVMALQLLVPPFSGGYPYELKSLFAAAADRVAEDWPDPAGLGPNVNSEMTSSQKAAARQALLAAENAATTAIRLNREGKTGEALRAWRDLFGPQFPLS